MRVAALYDVHGNVPALEAVLADPRFATAGAVVVGGDVVAGPDPGGALERLEALGDRVRFLRGNADRETVSPESAQEPLVQMVTWARNRLSVDQLERVAAWPATVELEVDGLGTSLFCHATPRSDTELVTRITAEDALADVYADVDAAVVVCGHVHVQYDRTVGRHRLVNAGSVGMPYQGRPGAYWALLGEDVELCRTPYDVDAAIDVLRASGYPDVENLVQQSVRGGASPDEVTAFFESQRGT